MLHRTGWSIALAILVSGCFASAARTQQAMSVRRGTSPSICTIAGTRCSSSATTASTALAFNFVPTNKVHSGDPLSIRLTGLSAGATVEITAQRLVPADKPTLYRSSATFQADTNGVIDLATTPALSGSFTGIDPTGLFWSMLPTTASIAGFAPGLVQLQASAAGKPLAIGEVTLLDSDPNVRIEAVDAFAGAVLAHPPRQSKPPVLIVLGGSEGGATTARSLAGRLAPYGFAVLGLPYYSPDFGGKQEVPGLPSSFARLPVDRLAQVRAWLQKRSDIDASRIAIYGVSKGAEFALIAASKYPWLTSVVAVVPSDVVWEGWGATAQPPGSQPSFSFEGKALPFTPYDGIDKEFAKFSQPGAVVRLRIPHDAGRRANPERAAAARIRVEDFAGEMMVVGGMEDQVWASGLMAQNIAERRAEAGRKTTALIYPEAGHPLSGDGWKPTTDYGAGLGGSPAGNAHAQYDAWPKTIAFLLRTLKVSADRDSWSTRDRMSDGAVGEFDKGLKGKTWISDWKMGLRRSMVSKGSPPT
ncbi:acyl-CoA thioesterase/bile acid-CoA:amino acid N-acyltransferase family protein [Gloeobacter kilaueensis]|uniref:Esterase n=1 Tax=Gloeobacter kilaueensis (strain ATCC BAA-2537 / CCAP 1431/1 / ULC 316 / JS1) TaxID=1183438 RepID=U5QED4_GLOK1|nr:acyl-CoA thioesterase/bile acid-CoA:amino acid N-acyltransferase family protein [Gloeobacter kilaueensis]AGY57286.1 esterase [Gloeobacter kilaueensis JS1]